jgi:16S rRNA (uracil1498-N3)-methyltransferase
MADRYFLETPVGNATTAELLGAEAHHLGKVMRAQPGDEVLLFDGSGSEFHATIASVSKQRIALDIVSRNEINREGSRSVSLAVALPKGERQRFLIEKLVELGATRLIPLMTRHSVAEADEHVLERLRRQVIEATKQCGRNRLMEIDPPSNLATLVARESADPAAVRVLAHPTGTPQENWRTSTQPLLAAIGPEGGFSDDEVQCARASDWQIISLGPRILRVETAALAVAALGNTEFGMRITE